MSSNSDKVPVTELLYLEIDPAKDLKNASSEAGRIWEEILHLSEQHEGFHELYWGRGLEDPAKLRLHIVRDTVDQHDDFRGTEAGKRFDGQLLQLIKQGTSPISRYVLLQDFTPIDTPLARTAPVTGTALYLSANEVFNEYAWPLWTHIVRHAPGNRGVAGGRLLTPVDGQDSYLVYVGWETNEHHQKFRQSPLCSDRRIILTHGNSGQYEYYHIMFEGRRLKK